MKDKTAFLFSLTHKVKCPIKDANRNAVYDYNSYGPTWGGGHDLYICNNFTTSNSSYSNTPHDYDTKSIDGVETKHLLAGGYNFKLSVMEVWQVKNFLDKKR